MFNPIEGKSSIPPENTRNTATLGCTLEAYAKSKGLPAPFLQGVGVSESRRDDAPVVKIPYFDQSGNETCIRFRVALTGDKRFLWRKGSKPCLYGLDRLSAAVKAGYRTRRLNKIMAQGFKLLLQLIDRPNVAVIKSTFTSPYKIVSLLSEGGHGKQGQKDHNQKAILHGIFSKAMQDFLSPLSPSKDSRSLWLNNSYRDYVRGTFDDGAEHISRFLRHARGHKHQRVRGQRMPEITG
jgi:hypothetical protein